MCRPRFMLFVPGLLCALAGCSPDVRTTAFEPPSFSISDAAHQGNPHFFFLPPMLPQPAPAGAFDGTRAPEVRICEWSGGDCAAVIAAFTMATGPGSETVRVSVADEHYIVDWHTSDFALDPSKTYRIRVLVDGVELGFADVELGENRQELRNVNTDQYVPLLEGGTLPIKFRIEEGGICLAPPPGMVAWWPGDGNAIGIVGGDNGTLVNGVTFAPGNVGQAFALDGVDDYVRFGDILDGLNTGFTLDAWIRTTATVGNKAIIAKYWTMGGSWVIRTNESDPRKVDFTVCSPSCESLEDHAVQLVSTSNINDGTWHFIAATFDGITQRLIIDGALQASATNSNPAWSDNHHFCIASYCDPSGNSFLTFSGLIDEVEIYNRALTADEIAAIYNAGSAGKCKG